MRCQTSSKFSWFGRIFSKIYYIDKNDTNFKFGPHQKEAFMKLIEQLCDTPILRMYNPSLDMELHTDASVIGYGCCLLQKQIDDGNCGKVSQF